MEYKCTVSWPLGCSTKLNPNTGGTNYYTWNTGSEFYASDIIRDTTDPNNPDKLWAKISRGLHAGKYVAIRYPSSSGNPVRASYTLIEPEIPPTGVVLTHTIEVYSDGSIKIDGIPYP
jgi:hypothetical protein